MGSSLFLLLIPYFIGAIPFGFLIGKCKGVDIRKEGSCNVGATNVFRVIGKKWGIFCFILDFLKGFLSLYLINFFTDSSYIHTLTLLFVVLGHMYSVFLKFKGGKGVATCMGGLSCLFPFSLLGIIFIWLIVFYSFHYVSLASILAGFFLPVLGSLECYIKGKGFYDVSVLILILVSFIIIIKHKANIKRLINKEEYSFKKENG